MQANPLEEKRYSVSLTTEGRNDRDVPYVPVHRILFDTASQGVRVNVSHDDLLGDLDFPRVLCADSNLIEFSLGDGKRRKLIDSVLSKSMPHDAIVVTRHGADAIMVEMSGDKHNVLLYIPHRIYPQLALALLAIYAVEGISAAIKEEPKPEQQA